MSSIIFQIDGGLGKSIMATAVVEGLKKKYPKENLIVITAYPQVFIGNPHIHKVYSHDNLLYFYKDIIDGQKVKAFLHNPYNETAYIERSEHLLETWFKMFGLTYRGELPQLHLSQRELDFNTVAFSNVQKPIMVIQTNGGAANQPVKYSWMRDLPIKTAQDIVDHFAEQYTVFHIRREDQFALNNTTPIHGDFRQLATLISVSEKRLFIDSFAQHTAAALNLPSVVCWIGNTPKQFGYEMHRNIEPNPETRKGEIKNAVFQKYNMIGDPTEFPYNHESEIFNVDDIINAVSK